MVMFSLILLSRTQRYGIAVCAVLLLSGGWAAMINVANPVMYEAYDNKLLATNLGDFYFGLGTFLTPACVAILIRKLGFQIGVSLLAGLAAAAAVVAVYVNMEPEIKTEAAPFADLLNDPVMWLCAATLMVWAPLESATAAWATTFVKDQAPAGEDEGKSKRIAAWILSGFWLCFMGSRLLMALIHSLRGPEKGVELTDAEIAAQIAEQVHEARVLHIALAVCAIIAMIVLVRSRKRGLTIGIILFAGLIMGPFFPSLVTILLSHFDANLHGRAIGVLFAGASIGWTLIPLVIGGIAKKSGSLHRGFVIAILDAIVLLGLVIAHFIYAGTLAE
jgi:fucose permease